MKISSSASAQGPKSVDRTAKKSRAGDARFSLEEQQQVEDTAPAAATGAMGPIASIDALLAIQEAEAAPTSTEGRSKGLKRGNDLLDMLEGIRRAILLGVISVGDLRALADTARNRQGGTGNAQLDDILREIELRAEVELAKYGY